MNNNNQKKYRQFSENEKKLPLFSRSWWLDAVTEADGGIWDAAIATKGDEICGVMPYVIKNNKILHPAYTPRLGPYLIVQENLKYQTKLHQENETLTDLISKIPEFKYFAQSFYYPYLNWISFYWKGFSATPRYSFVIKADTNPEILIKESHQTLRKCFNKAEKIVTVKEIDNIKILNDLSNSVLTKKNIIIANSLKILQTIDSACKNHSCSKILAAFDSLGNIHAALYIVWDDFFVYSLAGGSDYNFRSSQAVSLLYKEAVLFALNSGRGFDFEGTMLKEVEPQFRQFGAIQTMYLHVYKDNRSFFDRGIDYFKRRFGV